MVELKSPGVSVWVGGDNLYIPAPEQVTVASKESVGTGILHPMSQNRFKFELLSWPDKNNASVFAMQMISVETNLYAKWLNVVVQQPGQLPNSKLMMKMINSLIGGAATFKLTTLDGNENVTSSIRFERCMCTTHNMVFDYSTGSAVQHALSFMFEGYYVD